MSTVHEHPSFSLAKRLGVGVLLFVAIVAAGIALANALLPAP